MMFLRKALAGASQMKAFTVIFTIAPLYWKPLVERLLMSSTKSFKYSCRGSGLDVPLWMALIPLPLPGWARTESHLTGKLAHHPHLCTRKFGLYRQETVEVLFVCLSLNHSKCSGHYIAPASSLLLELTEGSSSPLANLHVRVVVGFATAHLLTYG